MSGDRPNIPHLLWRELRSLATVFAVVGVLAGGWFGARLVRDGWIRGELWQRIRTSTDADLKKWCDEAANAGPVGIALLFEIVDWDDVDQATQAGESLRELFLSYEALSPRAAGNEYSRFLDLCIDTFDTLGPRGRDLVSECCERYLLWRHHHAPRDTGRPLLQCQTLLARLAGRSPRDLGLSPPSRNIGRDANPSDGAPPPSPALSTLSVDAPRPSVDGPAGGGLDARPFGVPLNDITNPMSMTDSTTPVIPDGTLKASEQPARATDMGVPSDTSNVVPSASPDTSANLSAESNPRRRLTGATLASSRSLHSRDSTVVHDNYRLLRDSGWDDGEVDLAYRATHESASIRLEAILLTRQLPVELAEEWLWHLSQDADAEVRLAALAAMMKLESKSFRVRFEALAENDSDLRVRSLAAIAGRLFHVDPEIRHELAKEISVARPALAGTVLLRLSHDEKTHVRIAAMNALATMTAPAAWSRIAEMYRTDPDPDVRLVAGQRVAARESLERP